MHLGRTEIRMPERDLFAVHECHHIVQLDIVHVKRRDIFSFSDQAFSIHLEAVAEFSQPTRGHLQ